MDPQQRLLLEFGYIALHAVCGLRESLRAADVGVFLRIMNADFATLHMQGKSVYAATGGTISIAAGRISFVLGTQGPCGSYDTACSSALVALHGTASAMSAGECPTALLGLVGLLLALVKSSTRGAGLLYLRGGGPVNDSLRTAEV